MHRSHLKQQRLNDEGSFDVELSDVSQAQLRTYYDELSEFADNVATIQLLSFLENSYYFYATKRVYAEIYPGALSIISARLLAPTVTHFEARLNPGFCPYDFTPDDIRKGQVSAGYLYS